MNRKERGFTMVELMLAMALVTFIFLFTLTVLTQLLTTYNRGLALTQINQAIRQLDNDIGKELRFSSPGAFNNKYYDSSGNVTANLKESAAGVFCTGTVAYVWNVGNNGVFTYKGTNEAVRLVRIAGAAANGVYCTGTTREIPKGNNSVDVGSLSIKSEDTTSLLGSQAMVLRAIVSGGTHVGRTFWFNGRMITCRELGAVYTDNGNPVPATEIGAGVCSGTGRLVKVQFALSTAGEFRASIIEGEEGSADERITCENTAHAGQYCSFGEFNSVVYLRGK